jgi:hypothetical protein
LRQLGHGWYQPCLQSGAVPPALLPAAPVQVPAQVLEPQQTLLQPACLPLAQLPLQELPPALLARRCAWAGHTAAAPALDAQAVGEGVQPAHQLVRC